MESTWRDRSWGDIWATPTVQAVLSVLVLCVLIAAAFYVMARFRDYTAEDRLEPESGLPNFREMLRRGVITEAEYRMIQSKSNGDSVAVDSSGSPSSGDSVRTE